ncbi:MAG: DUF4982 domain-containing protein [Bacteroidales bacterium]|nr:DUF4982 domain-containing protein [Bacteroidales bacterium]
MKTNSFAAIFMAIFATSTIMAQSVRTEQNWNSGWRFSLKDDAEAKEMNYDDKSWRNVTIPHDWSIDSDFRKDADMGNEGGYLPAGTGWYRKQLNMPKEWAGKTVKLMFDGVYQDSKIYVNGDSVGSHFYGYTPFVIDITKQLKMGNNVIALRVDNSQQKNCRWYSGSGIYRKVQLIVSDPVHIAPWGVAVTTPKVERSEATVLVQTDLTNDGNAPRNIKVRVSVPSENISEESPEMAILPNSVYNKATQELIISNPKLWNTDTPNLYEAKVEILENGKVIDEKTEKFGIRTVEYDAQNGLRINGVKTLINGGCAHHDNGILGAATYRNAEYRKARLLKEAGFNLVRTSHNPPSEDFLRACDEIGIMVIDEAFDGWIDQKNTYDYHLRFQEESSDDVAAMVLRDRNHPSIISWSIGNEIIERKHISSVTTAQRLKNAILKHDKTRPVTEALCAWDRDWEIYDPHAAVLDITGLNYMMFKAEGDHERVPERVMWQTESYPRDAFKNWTMVNDKPYVIGDVVWTAIDYLGESGIGRFFYEGETDGEPWMKQQFPWHGAYCGDIDLVGWRKPISHYREMLYFPDHEKLYMAVKEPDGYFGKVKETMWSVWPTWECWTWEGHEGKDVDVEIYSRYPKVRLYLNGKLIGERPTTRAEEFKATFKVPYQAGTLKAVGVDDQGNEVENRTLTTAGKVAGIRLTTDGNKLTANEDDVCFVTVELVDKNGIRVQNAEQELHFEVKGNATLVGTGTGDLKDTVSYTNSNRKTYKGMAMAVVRSNGKGGKATLIVTGKGIRKQINL